MNMNTDATLLALAERIEVLSRILQEVCRSDPSKRALAAANRARASRLIVMPPDDLFDTVVGEATASELAGMLRALSPSAR